VNLLKGRSTAETDSNRRLRLGRQGLDHSGHRRSTPRTTRGRDVLD